MPSNPQHPGLPLRAIALLAILCAGALASIPRATSQDASQEPSIIGTSPLGGLSGATGWINSPPLRSRDLKGKVVLVDFWTYSCINCLRSLPYIEAWSQKYKDAGLVVIGVHTPEFDFEKESPNVQKAVTKFGVTYPIALDSDQAIWNAFHNDYWPAHYFIDAKGKVRFEHFGEGNYEQSERWIQQLLQERNSQPMPGNMVNVNGEGIEAASDNRDVQSPETYIGFARAEHFASPGGIRQGLDKTYTVPAQLQLNQWGLDGKWIDHEQIAILRSPGGKIVFRFHARDLHLVLGPTTAGKPVAFRVTIDGQAPGDNHGVDTDAQGNGQVNAYRLYQLVREKGAIADHTFTIEFQDPGVQAFSFTFG